jgi:hypothetical protein
MQLNQGATSRCASRRLEHTALVVLEGEVIINGSESAREGQLPS